MKKLTISVILILMMVLDLGVQVLAADTNGLASNRDGNNSDAKSAERLIARCERYQRGIDRYSELISLGQGATEIYQRRLAYYQAQYAARNCDEVLGVDSSNTDGETSAPDTDNNPTVETETSNPTPSVENNPTTNVREEAPATNVREDAATRRCRRYQDRIERYTALINSGLGATEIYERRLEYYQEKYNEASCDEVLGIE